MSINILKHDSSARVLLSYPKQEITKAILMAIEPDNFSAPEGVKLEANVNKNNLVILVSCSKGVGSLLATLDDMIQCIQVAENALMSV